MCGPGRVGGSGVGNFFFIWLKVPFLSDDIIWLVGTRWLLKRNAPKQFRALLCSSRLSSSRAIRIFIVNFHIRRIAFLHPAAPVRLACAFFTPQVLLSAAGIWACGGLRPSCGIRKKVTPLTIRGLRIPTVVSPQFDSGDDFSFEYFSFGLFLL